MPRWVAATSCAFIGLLGVLLGLMANGDTIRDHDAYRRAGSKTQG